MASFGCDVTMITSATQNQFFGTFLVNANSHTKFGGPVTFGLRVRRGAFFPRVKCIGQTPCVE